MTAAASRQGALRAGVARPQRSKDPARLELVQRRRRRLRRAWIAPTLSLAIVSTSLFAVVIAHAELAQGQVRLANVQAALTSAEVLHRQQVLSVASLENPSRILRTAEAAVHMAPPGTVVQVPHVPLNVPISGHAASSASSSSSNGSSASSSSSNGSSASGT